MNVSPVQSSAKCGGSDFSIERILSNDGVNLDQSVEAPSWLCCTRYQPPRLPLSKNSLARMALYGGAVIPSLMLSGREVFSLPTRSRVKLLEDTNVRCLVGSASAACRSRRSGRHARVPFTAAQAAALEAAYSRAPYLAPPALRALAAALQLRDDRIKIWFQNRRARERREKSSTITVPHEVTLPPTFHPRTLLTVGGPWPAQQSTAVNIQISQSDSTRLNNQTQDLPRDLTCPTAKSLDYNKLILCNDDRPDTPLDVESID